MKNYKEAIQCSSRNLSPSGLFTDYASYTLHRPTKYMEKANSPSATRNIIHRSATRNIIHRSTTRNIIHHVRDQNHVQNSRQ